LGVPYEAQGICGAGKRGKPLLCPTKLSAVNECDETFVLESLKGSEMPEGYWREARKHGAKAEKRGISNAYICICTGIGREGSVVAVAHKRAKLNGPVLKEVSMATLTKIRL